MTLEELHDYMDPFSNECRVYGRLKGSGKEHLAIECHGYLVFTEEYLQTKGIEVGYRMQHEAGQERVGSPDLGGNRTPTNGRSSGYAHSIMIRLLTSKIERNFSLCSPEGPPTRPHRAPVSCTTNPNVTRPRRPAQSRHLPLLHCPVIVCRRQTGRL
jgi:hypothetical protein